MTSIGPVLPRDTIRTIPLVNLESLVVPKVRERFRAFEERIKELEEENRRLQMRVAQFEEYERIVEFGKRIDEIMAEFNDR